MLTSDCRSRSASLTTSGTALQGSFLVSSASSSGSSTVFWKDKRELSFITVETNQECLYSDQQPTTNVDLQQRLVFGKFEKILAQTKFYVPTFS